MEINTSVSAIQTGAAASAPNAPVTQARPAKPVVAPESAAAPRDLPPEQNPATLRDAVQAANKTIQQVTSGIEFSLDEDTGKMVVRVVDTATQEVLRQIPSEEMLAIARAIDRVNGVIINQQA